MHSHYTALLCLLLSLIFLQDVHTDDSNASEEECKGPADEAHIEKCSQRDLAKKQYLTREEYEYYMSH